MFLVTEDNVGIRVIEADRIEIAHFTGKHFERFLEAHNNFTGGGFPEDEVKAIARVFVKGKFKESVLITFDNTSIKMLTNEEANGRINEHLMNS